MYIRMYISSNTTRLQSFKKGPSSSYKIILEHTCVILKEMEKENIINYTSVAISRQLITKLQAQQRGWVMRDQDTQQ